MKRTLIVAIVLGLAAYSLQAGAIRKGDPAQGREKAETCIACHGADGVSQNPDFPHLAGQYPDYMVRAMLDYRSGARQNPIMNGIAADLSERDMWDLAAYYSTQRGPLHVKEAARRGPVVELPPDEAERAP